MDRLTGDRSLCPPDVAITSHVPSSICREPDIDLQLADPWYVGDHLEDVSMPVCQVGYRHGS